jgi:hypothetical protein
VQPRPGGAMNLIGSGYNFLSQLIRIHGDVFYSKAVL